MVNVVSVTNAQTADTQKKYVCSMHPNETSDKPGKCPECGMDYVLSESLNKQLLAGVATMPSVKVWDLKGHEVDVSTLRNDNKPFVMLFWATWCAPCMKELNNVADVYEDWQKETGVKIYAISVDDSRTSAKVATVAAGYKWDYTVLLDKNQDLSHSLNFTMPPYQVLLDANGKIVWVHNSYLEGDEFELGKKIKELAKK